MKNFLKEIYFTILYLFSIGFRKYKKIDKSVSGLLPVNYCFDIGASYYAFVMLPNLAVNNVQKLIFSVSRMKIF